MSRQAGSIVRGFQSRAGYPSQRAGCRSRLCTAQPAEGQVAATKRRGAAADTTRLENRGVKSAGCKSEACLGVRCNLQQAAVRYRSNHCAAQYSSAVEEFRLRRPSPTDTTHRGCTFGARSYSVPDRTITGCWPQVVVFFEIFSLMGDQENRFGGHSARKSCRRVNPSDPHFCVGGNDGTEVRHNQTIF
jgi:hypothetical protein